MLNEEQKKSLKRKRSKLVTQCPYCGGKVIYRSADGIYQENTHNAMLFVCSNYPRCDAYVRAIPGTQIPVGSLANSQLRRLRLDAHKAFDELISTGIMKKNEAYAWLERFLNKKKDEAHIGRLDEYACKQVISECEKIRANNEWRIGSNGKICRQRRRIQRDEKKEGASTDGGTTGAGQR